MYETKCEEMCKYILKKYRDILVNMFSPQA